MGPQWLWRLLPQLRLLAAAPAFVFLIRRWWRRKPRRRWIRQKLQASVGASQFSRLVHASRGAGTRTRARAS
jgi:hypothetical protein